MQRVALLGSAPGRRHRGKLAEQADFPSRSRNRTPAKAEALAAMGARGAETPGAAAEGADVIVAMVADDAASRAVLAGASCALLRREARRNLHRSSTLSPEWVRELAGLAKARGCRFLDAPIGASRQAAAAGQLVFFVGGEADAVAAAEPVLEAIATRVVHVGGTGAGATWKLINNMLIAVELAAVAEALALGPKSRIRRRQGLGAHRRKFGGQPHRESQARAHDRGQVRRSRFRALSHSQGRPLRPRARPGAWRASRHGGCGEPPPMGAIEAMGLGAMDCAAVAT